MTLLSVFSRSLIAIAVPVVASCAVSPASVRPGDQTGVSFSCCFANGDLAVSSSSTIGLNDGRKRSPVFFPRESSDPIVIEAGQPTPVRDDKVRPMEEEVLQHLRKAVIGMHVGDNLPVELHSSITGRSVIKYNRKRTHPKERRLTVEEFKATTGGSEPKTGADYTEFAGFPGKVAAVDGDNVTVKFTAVPGGTADEFFGRGVISDDGDHYGVFFSAEKGTVVRSGYMVGKVVDITDTSISVDFGDPFAGETLKCDVKVESIKPAAAKTDIPAEGGDASRKQLLDALKSAAADGRKTVTIDAGSGDEKAAKPDGTNIMAKDAAMNGDLAMVDYTATLDDGSLFFTTRREKADDAAIKKVAWFTGFSQYGAEAVTVGKAALLPGVGEALAGMRVGEKKRLNLTPDQAFGQPDPKKTVTFPVSRTLSRQFTLSAEDYVKRVGGFPVAGREVSLVPYFPAKVVSLTDKEVKLEFQARDGAETVEPFGVTKVGVSGDTITVTLKPVIGAAIPLGQGIGVIMAADGNNMTVDLNNPLAGRKVVIDMELKNLEPAASLPGDVPWHEDHDTGLAGAKKAGKPAVLVLYADWCSFCKKLFGTTMPDPRITSLSDRFTWIRVNSDKLTELKKRYGQEGYPMVVLFRSDGTVAGKLDGYQEPSVLRAALMGLL